jgi:hypothetical protein
VLPLAAAGVVYSWFGQAIVNALEVGEWATAALLLLPSGLTVFLTGPVPARMARLVTHWAAVGAAVLAPFLIGAIFLRAPILPTVALEFVSDSNKNLPHESLGGHAITVDDRMTTLLDKKGTVRFIPNDQIVSKTLCPEDSQVPYSVVVVHAWPVEQTALAWLTATPEPVLADPRCQGRPLVP